MHPTFPSSELLLIGRHHLNLQVILEVLEEAVLLKQAGPADLAALAQKVITDAYPPSELILHMGRKLFGVQCLYKCIYLICEPCKLHVRTRRVGMASSRRLTFVLLAHISRLMHTLTGLIAVATGIRAARSQRQCQGMYACIQTCCELCLTIMILSVLSDTL